MPTRSSPGQCPTIFPIFIYVYIPLLHIYFFHVWLIFPFFFFFSDVLMQFLSTVTEVLWMLIGNSITFLCVLGYLSLLLLGLSCKSSGKNVKEEIMCVCVCSGDQTQGPSVHDAGNCSLFSREIGSRYEEALGAMSGTYCFIHGLCQRCLPSPNTWAGGSDEQMLCLRGALGHQNIPHPGFSTGFYRNLRLRGRWLLAG